MYVMEATVMDNTATANEATILFNVGDKVRHNHDVEDNTNYYGTGVVTAVLYDRSGGFYYYNVEFPTGRGQWITQYAYWDLRKVG
jgi:hypothetical protein